MKKSLLLAFFPIFVWAQAPEPCGPEGEMEPFCEIACIICDIDGFSGRNDENENGIAPPDFCTTTQHNIQWLAFIAGTENLTLRLEVGDCPNSFWQALEVTVYEAVNCENPRMVFPCNGSVGENTSWTFSNTEPLTIGQYYFFVMDGDGGSVCDYTVHVEEGSTKVPDLLPTEPFDIPDPICENQAVTLYHEAQVGATIFEWMIDGVPASNADSIIIDLSISGTVEVCVEESNACDVADPFCTLIEVSEQPRANTELVICDGEPVFFNGTEYSSPGIYEDITVPAEVGCDSVYTLIVTASASVNTSGTYNICQGDTLVLNGESFFENGDYQQDLLTVAGCDSIVGIDLSLIICNMEGSAFSQDLLCHGDGATGSIFFRIEAGTPPFTYSYEKVLDESIIGTGNVSMDNVDEEIAGLPAGVYLITVNDLFGNSTIIIAEILEPEPISITSTFSDYEGVAVSCANGTDGSISVIAVGGTPDYEYAWNGASFTTDAMINNLGPGTHSLVLRDANGCLYEETFFLNSPNPIEPQLNFFDPNCEGLETGYVQIGNVIGGVSPYAFSLNGSPFESMPTYENLTQGDYMLITEDANGCQDTIFQSLENAQIPEIILPEDITVTLGDSTIIVPEINDITIDDITWTTSENMNCFDCLEPTAGPLNTATYTLSISSEDGCTREENMTIFVDKSRAFFAPNIFHPASNGINGFFFLDGGQQIDRIQTLRVYDRWGNLIFEGDDLEKGVADQGWDGSFNGADAQIGVYTWIAEIRFLDGFIETVGSDVLLVR